MRFFGNPFRPLILSFCFGLTCLFSPLTAGEQGKGKSARETAEAKASEKETAPKKIAKKTAAAAETEKGKTKKTVKEKVKLGPLAKEKVKHIKRLAKIDRLEEIARKKNNEKLLKQIQMLREKESRRHEKVMARLGSTKTSKAKETGKKKGSKTEEESEESEKTEKATEE